MCILRYDECIPFVYGDCAVLFTPRLLFGDWDDEKGDYFVKQPNQEEG